MSPHPSPSRLAWQPEVLTLPNGIRVAIDHVPSVDSCALGIWVQAGTRDEPRGQNGVAHLVEHASFRRTRSRTNHRIAREFENVGAYANADTSKEETTYYVRTLTDHLRRVLPTLADVVLQPVFLESDVRKERDIIVEEIRSYEDEAEEYILDLAERQLFGDHPLGLPIVGTVESVQQIEHSDVRAFHNQHYHAGSMVVAISGNVDRDYFIDLLQQSLSAVPANRKGTPRRLPKPKPPAEQRMARAVQQAHVVWHVRTPGHRSPTRAALALLNIVLGDGMSSRLHVRLRENSGLAYTIASQIQLFTDVGMFSVYAGTDPRREGKAALLIERELQNLALHGIKPAELKRAKEQARAARIMSLESLSSRMGMLGKGLLDDGEPEDPYAAISELLAMTKEEVDDLAAGLCDPTLWHRFTLVPSRP
jgi:predicted Zn-dependent peptidase